MAEILQERGLPISIRRGPALLLLDVQCLALGGRGYLGLNRGRLGPSRGCLGLSRGYLGLDRGCLGLGRVVDLDGGLTQVSGEDVRGTVVRPEAILASSFAVSLYCRATWLSSSP